MLLNPLAVVSLDLDDTLWPTASLIAGAERAGLAWFEQYAPHALPTLAAERRDALRRRAVAELDHLDRRRTDMRWLRQRLYFLALEDAGYDTAQAEAAFKVFDAARQLVEPFADAIDALERLSRRYPLIAITNGSADLKRIGWSHYFKLLVSPAEAGAAKPDPHIYRHACEAFGVAPQQVLHVGDDAVQDVAAAKSAGLQAVWINRLGVAWPGPGPAPVTFDSLSPFVAWLEQSFCP